MTARIERPVSERCFACDRVLTTAAVRVRCRDDQQPFVGVCCARKIRRAGSNGYQPPKGGPTLFSLEERP